MKIEYKVADLQGDSPTQEAALSALGAEGWVMVGIEHMGSMAAKAYLMRQVQQTDDGRGDPVGVAGGGIAPAAAFGAPMPNEWPPARSAVGLADGDRAHGSTGQLFEARNGQWVRVHDTGSE